MIRKWAASRPSAVRLRSWLAATAVVGLVAAALVPAGTRPAQAADTVQCGTPASVFATASDGTLYLYPLNYPGSTSSTWSSRKAIGNGWDAYGRVLGGPNGFVYAIKSSGMYRYHWTGSGWQTYNGAYAEIISTSFATYATAEFRNKITVDERGDFYLIDRLGKLRWYRYDEASKTWPIYGRVLDSGWDKYDLIVTAGVGVIYARAAADGKFYRSRFEPTSQRWIVQNKDVGSGWGVYSKGLYSVGGDTLFGITGDGYLRQYRYREDNNTWAINARQIGTSWQNFLNVTATTNTCTLNVSYVPAQPAAPLQNFTPTQAMQAATKTVEYAYTDNIGRLLHGRQDPDNFGSTQWTVLSGNEAFSGQPALTHNSQDLVQVLGRNTDSDVWSRTQKASGSPDWNDWSDLSGRMNSTPAVVELSDGTQVAFALDGAGAVWSRPQDGTDGDLLPWRLLGGSGLTGIPTVVAVDNGAALVFALDANGTVQTARYQNGALSAWTSLGGSGFTGRIAAVLMPGYSVRVFVADSAGQIMTQQQGSDGSFPGTWQAVGSGLAAAGSPSALLSPVTGRIGVYIRGTDGYVYYAGETAQGSGVWDRWVSTGGFETYATDPTAFTFTNSNGPVVAYVVRTSDQQSRVYTVDENATMSAGLAAEGGDTSNTAATPTFVRHDLPAPPVS